MNSWLNNLLGETPPVAPSTDARTRAGEVLGRLYGAMPHTLPATDPMSAPDTPAEPSEPTTAPSEDDDDLVTIGLDVSVGIDDPATRRRIHLTFDGLPDGARMNHGTSLGKDRWRVNAADIDDLAVVARRSSGDFELGVTMEMPGMDPQHATIRITMVATPDALTDGKSLLTFRLAPPLDQRAIELSVYADGQRIFGGKLSWPKGADIAEDIAVACPGGDGLPYELVIRVADGSDAVEHRIALLGLEIDGVWISPHNPNIRSRGDARGGGLTWQGDMIIDLRKAIDASRARNEAPQPRQVMETDKSEGAHIENGVEPRPDVATISDPETATEPNADDLASAEPEGTPAAISPMTLWVSADNDDLRREGFIAELKRLRTFIRNRPMGDGPYVYDRLDMDVAKWSDLRATGPSGFELTFDAALPTLGVSGGRDGGRLVEPLNIRGPFPPATRRLRVRGLPPGAMLTVGQNTGDGCWDVEIEAAADLAVMMPAFSAETSTCLWELLDAGGAVLLTGTFITGDHLRRLSPPSHTDDDGISIFLSEDRFDPKGLENLSLTIGDVPPGVLLSGGSNHGDGVWTMDGRSGEEFSVFATAVREPFFVTVTCIAMDEASGDSSVVTQRFDIDPDIGTARLHGRT